MDATAKAPADFSLRRYGAPADSTLEGFLFPATYELVLGASVARPRQAPARRYEANFAKVRHDRREARNLDALRRADHRLDGRARGAARARAAARSRRSSTTASSERHPARDRRDDPLRDRTTGRGRSRSPSSSATRPTTRAAPRAAADADRQPRARLDQGGRATRPRRDYLFYVRKPGKCGEHAFSRSDAQFERDVAAYQAAREATAASPRRLLSASASAAGRWPTPLAGHAHARRCAAAGLKDWQLPAAAAAAGAVRRDRAGAAGAAGFRGVNVTIPHKEAALALADERHATPRAASAPPTRSPSSATARSTPTTPTRRACSTRSARRRTPPGGARSCSARAGPRAPPSGRSCGRRATCRSGTARRERARARSAAERRGPSRGPAARPRSWSTARPSGSSRSVRARSRHCPPGRCDRAGSCVVDMVYRAGGTRTRSQRVSAGSTVIDGLEILVGQGAASFERWTGTMAPIARRCARRLVTPSTDSTDHLHPRRRRRRGTVAPGRQPPPEEDGWHGVTKPSRRRRLRRVLTDVLVELGLVERAARSTPRSRRRAPAGIAAEQALLSPRRDHRRPARARRRRALRPRPRRPQPLPGRPRRGQARHARRRSSATRRCPVAFAGERTLLVAMADPANVLAVDDIAVMTGYEVRPAVVAADTRTARAPRIPSTPPRAASTRTSSPRGRRREPEPTTTPRAGAPIDFGASGEDAPVVKLVHRIIAEAVERGASDIHFEPAATASMRVRYRIDGVLHEVAARRRKRIAAGVVSRLKIMADLDIAERRMPQDGRIVARRIDGRHDRPPRRDAADGRAARRSSCASSTQSTALHRPRDSSACCDDDCERFDKRDQPAPRRRSSSPARPARASRRRSTRRSTQLNTPEKNIITIEDPVEYQLDGINQVQVNPQGRPDLRRRRCARSCAPTPTSSWSARSATARPRRSRSRPRSPATSCSRRCTPTTRRRAVTRLIEMGIEPFLVGSAVDCVVAQRLARLLCEECKQPRDRSPRTCCAPTASTSARDSRPTSRSAARAAAAPATRAGSASTR